MKVRRSVLLIQDSPSEKCPEIHFPWTLLWSSRAYLKEAQYRAVVNKPQLQGRNAQTIKRRGRKRIRVHSCDHPLFSSLCLSQGDNRVCRHQSHWQLLISPLHKRQEIIRIDQSTTIYMCMYECVCVCMGASWDLMNTNQPRGKWGGVVGGLRFDRYAPARVCVCVQLCGWWRGAWVTDQAPYDPQLGIWWGLQMINKVPAITSMHTHTQAHPKQQLSLVYSYHPPPALHHRTSTQTPPAVRHCQSPNTHSACSYKWRSMACKHTGYVTDNE